MSSLQCSRVWYDWNSRGNARLWCQANIHPSPLHHRITYIKLNHICTKRWRLHGSIDRCLDGAAMQFASFYHIFPQSPDSMDRRGAFHYILINTSGFRKVCLFLLNHLNSSCHSIIYIAIKRKGRNFVAVLFFSASNTYS
jgi:hypothetical protein